MYLTPSASGSAPLHRDGGSCTRTPTNNICAAAQGVLFLLLSASATCFQQATPVVSLWRTGHAPHTKLLSGTRLALSAKQLLTCSAVTEP